MSPLSDRLRTAGSYAHALYGWRKFMLRTVAWCSASVTLRPFTGERVPQKMMRHYFEDVLRQLGIEVRAEGVERLEGASPCIIAVNHNSMLDIPCTGVLLDFDYKWVSKKEIFHVPFIGWHLRACGHIPVDRQRKDNSHRLEQAFARVFRSGGSILMFPEGTRSTDGRLQPFRSGAFVAAVREGVPVLPVVLDGTERLLVKGSLEFPKHQHKVVSVKIGELIPPPPTTAGDHNRRVIQLRDQTRAAMVTLLDHLRGEPGAAERPTL